MGQTIKATEEDIKAEAKLTKALGLRDLQVVRQERDELEERIILYCIPRYVVDVCRQCGTVTSKIHDYPEQRTVHDAPLRGMKLLLVFDVHRLRCVNPTCEKVFTLRIQDVVAGCTYTKQLAEEIIDQRKQQSVQTLSTIYEIGYKTVESIVLKAAEAKEKAREREPIVVKQLGIDEQSNRKGHNGYVLVLTDLEKRIVVDILPNREKKTLINWLKTPPDGIDLSQLHTAATDLWAHYRDGVAQVFPTVAVVADRFHVMQNLHKTIHTVRRLAQKEATSDEEQQTLKGLRYLLLKKDEKLNDAEKERLAKLEIASPTLYALTRLRQRLYEWYQAPLTVEQATDQLISWLDDAAQLNCPALDKFCKTVRNWQQEIVNFFPIASRVVLSKG